MNKSHKSGFTLIEILIVIAIVGLLAAIILSSINSAKVKTRNSQRNSDTKQLLNAFSLGLANSPIPSTGGSWACVSSSCYGGWSPFVANSTVDSYISPYITEPTDPANSSRGYGGYLYNSSYGATGYDGTVFPTGAYIIWLLETNPTPTSCGAGSIFAIQSNYVQCFLKVN